jgi:hypothetical protein
MTICKIYAMIDVMKSSRLDICPQHQQELTSVLEPLCNMHALKTIYRTAHESGRVGPYGSIRTLEIENGTYDTALRIERRSGRYSAALSVGCSAVQLTLREYGRSRLISPAGTPISIGFSSDEYIDTSYPSTFKEPLYARQKMPDRLGVHASAIDRVRGSSALPIAELRMASGDVSFESGLEDIQKFADQLLDVRTSRAIAYS